MKHLIPAVLIILLATSLSVARRWKPFVAVSGVMDIPSEEVSYEPFEWRFATSDYIYPGTQFDVGAQSEKHEWYFAYHVSHSPQLDQYSSGWPARTDSSDIWYRSYSQVFRSEQRFYVGHRIWPTGHNAILNPYVGAGIGLGYSRHRKNTQTYRVEGLVDSSGGYYTDIREELYSRSRHSVQDNTYGGLVELGTSFKTWKSFEILLMTQLHVYTIKNRFWDYTWYDWYIMPSGVLQLRYVFR